MDESKLTLLNSLIALSKVDATIARLFAERKQIEVDLERRQKEITVSEKLISQVSKRVENQKRVAKEEEANIKYEHDKLTARRKSLSAVANYKLQEAAGREIDGALKQLEIREDGALKMLMELESSEAELVALQSKKDQFAQELSSIQSDSQERLVGIERRVAEKEAERADMIQCIDAGILDRYSTILRRYPTDPLAELSSNSCSGCLISLGPQMFQRVSRGDSLVQCGNCGRILYITPTQE